MRIYEGAPRQDYEEVLRSIGAILDQRGMRKIVLIETADGFLVQGLAAVAVAGEDGWTDTGGGVEKQSFSLTDEDVAKLVDDALARRALPAPIDGHSRFYQRALRVLGRYFDEQKPRDVFLFEQDHAFVVRLLMPTRTGTAHVLAEFTREDIEVLMSSGASLRQPAYPAARDHTPAG